MDKLTELSKEISYALRHAPWEYELEMDEEGWVPVEQLLDALHKEEKWRNISENDLVIMIQKSEKKRHEIFSGKIKAHYGHSIPMKIAKEEKVPPEVLYHGTARRFLNSIREKGLLPKGRQYVHLSQDVETAHAVESIPAKSGNNTINLSEYDLIINGKNVGTFTNERIVGQ